MWFQLKTLLTSILLLIALCFGANANFDALNRTNTKIIPVGFEQTGNQIKGGLEIVTIAVPASSIKTLKHLKTEGKLPNSTSNRTGGKGAPNRAIGFSDDTVGTAFAGMREGHAIRHLQGDIIPNTGSLQSRVEAFKEVVTPILTNPTKTALWKVGNTNGRGFLGSSNGKNVFVVVATEGPKQGKVITSFVPDANQLSIIRSR